MRHIRYAETKPPYAKAKAHKITTRPTAYDDVEQTKAPLAHIWLYVAGVALILTGMALIIWWP
ncbi:hypothetical protein [Asticcacaulis sp. AC466]|uniref:hypothetical protein n=1 Tax=Asticcacaulis sp. AC466 TaxID=1282362 RepID=UPI0012DE6F72|nr:hypothetical protein [Asticcacaulis sp. AC466]